MAELKKVKEYLDKLLMIDSFTADSSNNGLQLEGKEYVKKAFFGVDCCLRLFEKAAEENADFVFVHHGISWKDNLKRLTGYNARMIRPLFNGGVSLYAAHLPLDSNPELGHNILLAKMLSLRNIRNFAKYAGYEIGFMGEAPRGATVAKFAKLIDGKLNAKSAIFGNPDARIERCGVVSGGAGDCIPDAIESGLDCFVLGEVGHSSYHIMRDSGINVIAGGHYCTEKPGVIAVMEKLSSKFGIECEFIDLPTGM